MERILVGVDGSESGWLALDAALDLADPLGVPIVVAHVNHLSTLAAFGIGSTVSDVLAEDDELREVIEREIELRREETGVTFDLVVRQGRPAETLLEIAVEESCDLIVVGHRGHGGSLKWMGSVAQDVIHHSEVSVLVAR